MPFVEKVEISQLKPAHYNPRAIDESSLKRLDDSITLLGFAKPVIYTSAFLLLAGHQRSKVAARMKMSHVPGFLVERDVPPEDEAFFNQLHNGTDMDVIDSPVTLPPAGDDALYRFTLVPSSDVKGNHRAAYASLRKTIARLLMQYGNWGCVVATQSGAVISSAHYALSAAQISYPVRVYRIPDALEAQARDYFGTIYGKFNYEHLPRQTFAQAMAQPARLRSNGVTASSRIYEKHVEPIWQPRERLLDFGCGQGDYVRLYQAKGRLIHGIEFFMQRKVGVLERRTIQHMIDQALASLRSRGQFDIVVCDSVINSVDSLQAEADVIASAHAFAKVGGRLFFSTRSREQLDITMRCSRAGEKNAQKRAVEFLDEHGFTAKQRGEFWFFQKFHTKEQLTTLFSQYPIGGLQIKRDGLSWQIAFVKTGELPWTQVEGALRREFDLPWPNGESVGRAEAAVAAMSEAMTAADAIRKWADRLEMLANEDPLLVGQRRAKVHEARRQALQFDAWRAAHDGGKIPD